MKLQQLIAIFGMTALLGCQASVAVKPPSTPASAEQVTMIRESFKSQNPNVQVGVVADVLAAENLAAVEEVDLTFFHVGDTVCFIDRNTDPLVCGKVVRVSDTQVHVKYEKPQPGRREPTKGDIAVAFQ